MPQWGHLNRGGRAGAELQPTACRLFALALERVWWTKTILCQSPCCFGQLIAPEEILNLLLLFTGISRGLGHALGCAPVLAGRAASHPWDNGPWSHLCLSHLDFFAMDHVKVDRFAPDLHLIYTSKALASFSENMAKSRMTCEHAREGLGLLARCGLSPSCSAGIPG